MHGLIAEVISELVRRHPVPMIAGFILVITLAFLPIFFNEGQMSMEEQQRRESLTTYAEQMRQLDSMQQGLKDMSSFVSQQRVRLQESEQLVSRLQEEKRRIEPLVQADRKVVEAVFQLQEQRTATAIGRERWIGFAFGLGASLLASFIYAVVISAWRKMRWLKELPEK